jgi:hypothetical protein
MERSFADKSTRATEKILIEFLDFISMTTMREKQAKERKAEENVFLLSSLLMK